MSFVAAWDRVSDYDGTRGTVRTWLLVLAKYQALDRRRQLARRVDVPPEGTPVADPVLEQVLSRERQEALAASIGQLEPGIQAVMVCRYLLDMGIPEIASRLHLTRSQVDNRLSRGRHRLREQWDAISTTEGGESIGHRDDRVTQSLAALDDDLQGHLLEMTLADLPMDPHERLDPRRVSARTFARLGLPSAGGRRRVQRLGWRWVAGMLGAAVVAGAIIPNSVSATLGKVFHFVPGMGTVAQTTEGSPLAVLPEAAHGVWQGRPVQVTGMMVTAHAIIIELSGSGSRTATQVYLRTTTGRMIALSVGSAVGYGNEWTGDYEARGHLRTLLHALAGTVIIGPRPRTRIPVRLRLATGVRALSALGPTQTHHGVSLTAITAQRGPEADLTVVAQYRGPLTIVNTVPPFPVSAEPDIQITDASGHHYRATQVYRLGSNDQLTFRPTPGRAHYVVTVPEVKAIYSGHARVTLPVPSHGQERVDRHVQIGGISLDITTVQRMHRGGWGLRFYVKAPPGSATKILHGLQVNSPGSGGFAGQVNVKTGAVQWVEVGVPPRRDSVTLRLSQPQVYIRGPWTFHIRLPAPAERSSAHPK
ncbi:RNA polymerase sigma factor [Sulfobacillus harzensis]|uniref:Sigma-70 family RNA polymerase sigma factor n=1 Tax=Sulfobacillus harzensis TaxID=2729629 RepID=A0A7Y0L4I2_9FIRM|nr:sigma-70 family RNA polymerase sigma factor [Sulfobacillus harzensis]NMP23151.1 sigma-70 family RNA polymerase sigma factor [Sulfobacillus harzensis]